MEKVTIPEILYSVPFIKAWANCVQTPNINLVLDEIMVGLKEGTVSHFDDIDSWSDRLYEHIQTFTHYKKSADIPKDKSNLSADDLYEVEMVNLMACLMNVLHTLQAFDGDKFKMDDDPQIDFVMKQREEEHTKKYMCIITNRRQNIFKF